MLRFTVLVVLAALACCAPISRAATNVVLPGDFLLQTSVTGSNLASFRPGGLPQPLVVTLPSTTTTGLAVDLIGSSTFGATGAGDTELRSFNAATNAVIVVARGLSINGR